MKAIISALKAERRRLAKEAKRIDSALAKFGVGAAKRRKASVKKSKKATAKRTTSATKATSVKAEKTKKVSKPVETEIEAKRRRKQELAAQQDADGGE